MKKSIFCLALSFALGTALQAQESTPEAYVEPLTPGAADAVSTSEPAAAQQTQQPAKVPTFAERRAAKKAQREAAKAQRQAATANQQRDYSPRTGAAARKLEGAAAGTGNHVVAAFAGGGHEMLMTTKGAVQAVGKMFKGGGNKIGKAWDWYVNEAPLDR